jgi:RTA1 like protein
LDLSLLRHLYVDSPRSNAGSGIAASSHDSFQLRKVGSNLTLAGIVLQVVILLTFAAAASDFSYLLTSAILLSAEAQSIRYD